MYFKGLYWKFGIIWEIPFKRKMKIENENVCVNYSTEEIVVAEEDSEEKQNQQQ